jgi:hypothetical protein
VFLGQNSAPAAPKTQTPKNLIVPNRSQVKGMNGKVRVRDEYFIHPNHSQLKYVGNPWDGTNGITFSGLLLHLTFGVIIPNRSQNWNGRFFPTCWYC